MNLYKLLPLVATPGPIMSPSLYFCVCMDGDGVTYIQQQLDIDIRNKALGWNPSLFTLFELIDLHKMIPDEEVVNVILSDSQLSMLLSYVCIQIIRTLEIDDLKRSNAYDELHDVLVQATQITHENMVPLLTKNLFSK